jgi:hypothetical protein
MNECCLLRCMSPELALRDLARCPLWSLSGVKRTSQFKNGTSVCDPIRTWAFHNRAGHFDPAGQSLVTSR